MSELKEEIKSLAEKVEDVGDELVKQKAILDSLVTQMKGVADHVGALEDKKS